MKEFVLVSIPPLLITVFCWQYLLRRLWKKSICWAAAAAAAWGLWAVVNYNDRVKSAVLYCDDTVYSTQFTESRFRAIPVGASAAVVTERLGAPLAQVDEFGGNLMYWHFARRGKSSKCRNYWIKVVVVNLATGHVEEKIDEFYTP